MTLSVDISKLTLAELEIILIYGIGAFILYVVALIAIVAWEIRQAKQTQGSTSMLPYITKTFVYVFGWFVGVTLVFLVLISIMPGGGMNPANGIDGFWHIDWLNAETWKSLNKGVIKSSGTPQQLSSAKFMALTLMVIKLVYHIMLLTFFFMIFSFAYSIPSMKAKQANEEMSFGYIGNIAMSFVGSVIVYQLLLGIMSIFLTGLLDLALSLHKIVPKGSSEVSVLYDLTEFVRLGIDKAKEKW